MRRLRLGAAGSPQVVKFKESVIATFADLGISKPVVEALRARSIIEPFPVQEMVMRDALAGHDLLVQSPTGSGKTLAFGLPMLENLEPSKVKPQGLVLAPTRELASQIVDELASPAKARGIRLAAVYGGVGFGPQISAVKRADVLVATPGRLEDLIDRGAVGLEAVRLLVLDEADRMLDMGFRPAVDRIVAQTAERRQTLFFSATLAGAAGKAAAAYTTDALSHTHVRKETATTNFSHNFVRVESQGAKLQELVGQLRDTGKGRSLVFVRTKRGADRLVKRLGGHNVTAVAMHGDKSQRQRERALARFERGEVRTLVATDVAARGIDVADVTHVFNFDIPEDREGYVHRIGRSGRAGNSGTGISFILDDQMRDMRRIAVDLGLTDEFEKDLGAIGSARRKSRGGQAARPARAPRRKGAKAARR